MKSRESSAKSSRESSAKSRESSAERRKKSVRFTEGKSAAAAEDQVLRSPSRLGYSDDIPIIVESGNWENTSQDSNKDDFNFLDLKDITDEPLNSTQVPGTADIETKEIGQQTDFPASPTVSLQNTTDRAEHRKHFITSHKFLVENRHDGHSPKRPFEKTVFMVKSAAEEKLTKCKVTPAATRPISSTRVRRSQEYRAQSGRIDSGYNSRQSGSILAQESAASPTSNKELPHSEVTRTPGIRLIENGVDVTASYRESARVDATASERETSALDSYLDNRNQAVQPIRVDVTISEREASARESQLDKNKAVQLVSAATNMSYYTTELYSSAPTGRKQEKEELQQINERFSSYIQRVRLLSEQNARLDAGSFIKQTRILEEEVANLKVLYERELDVLRQEVDATSRERNNYQIQCQKNKQAAIDFESRLAVETDKNRRLMDDMNLLQRNNANLETELIALKQAGDGRSDFQSLQREMDKLIRENEDHKRRQEQESLLRGEADDRCHTLTKKLEFNEQVHAQSLAEVRERLEQCQATIISLESRLREASKNDIAIPEVLKQVREQAEMEFKRYHMESEEMYARNISALKCQMDNDASTIERLQGDKSLLQGQIGELNARIRNLEGQIMTLEHQRSTVEDLIHQERTRTSTQIKEMEKKLRDMQELMFTKMREASSARDLNVPLKAEIEALKVLLEEEEKRLQTPLTTSLHSTSTFVPASAPVTLPSVPATVSFHGDVPTATSQIYTVSDSPFVTQSAAHNQYAEIQGETLFQHVPLPPVSEPPVTDYLGATKYTYEATPSVNRLQIDSPSRPCPSPRVVGPITRAKSAPARHLVPTSLGQGKDYFDEMFKDLTRETLYTQTRAKSAGVTERPPSAMAAERPLVDKQQIITSRTDRLDLQPSPPPMEQPPVSAYVPVTSEVRPASSSEHVTICDRPTERPTSSVFHDYTTSTSSAVGDIKILEVNQDGKFVRLVNEGKQELEFGGYMIQQNVGGHPVAVFRFPPRTKFAELSTITIWSGTNDPIEHQPPKDFVWREQQKWGTGPECTTILCKPNGQAVAWMTAAHRFTKNPYEENGCPSPQEFIPDTGAPGAPATTQDEVLTEMNVNLNEPRPEPVYLRREKQPPPSLNAQKHPHGTSPGKEVHPHTGQARPFTYGNDNSSVNRQSRVQSTRPDPIPGQPYAGGSGNRIGSAPLRKYTTGTVRGSGAIANRSNPGVTSPPPCAFQTPHDRFESGLDQVKSQHHVDFLPPMPRPPLFSTW